ncbi:hypothetical protein [Butyricimonas sp.]|uniref:hypothetical protein n=1 Tax=Butyricimonas sp. TaxID=1969738 RepID=UPI0025C13ECF|nr:hypothetical protein [Butyricimonas sp.]
MNSIEAKDLFINNFIGVTELKRLFQRLGHNIDWDAIDMPIPFNDMELVEAAKDGYILVLVPPCYDEGGLSIRIFREVFGINPDQEGPCFYNQDWYLNEDFIDFTIEPNWYLLQKNPSDDTRAVMPDVILASKKEMIFPSAMLCTYTFFAYRLAYGENLWETDFVWCSDLDHNGDRIYVGKYHDVDGINRDGFSIHRHLKLRPCYSAIFVR